MKNKIVAFGASNSIKSINKKLAAYAANQIEDAEVQLLDLNDFEMPIYSIDREKETGIPALAIEFKEFIKQSDSIIISFAEHNGSYSTAFKNILDWISRINSENGVWENKPMMLMATSPGARGGKTVLETAKNSFKFMNKNSIFSFSLPSFHQNYNDIEGIIEESLLKDFKDQLKSFKEASLVLD